MRTAVELLYETLPYEHQREALELMWGETNFALFMEMGTGKSKIIVDETVNLIERDLINCVVILAPNGVHANWEEQYQLHGKQSSRWQVQVYKAKYGKKQENVTRDIINSGKVLVFLMNIEALSNKGATDYLYRILRARSKTYLCIDESHKIKTASALRTKNVIALGQYAKYRRIATGTEAEEGIHNLYSQMKFLDWKIIGFKDYTPFKSMYCRMGGFENRQIIGYQNQPLLAQKLAPYVYQKRKKECLDLPDKVYTVHHVDLTDQQREMYDTLEEQLLVELRDGSLVDASLAITRLIRLQQVLCGHLNTDTKHINIESNRAKLVSELVDSADKSIVFCRFVRDVQLVVEQLAMDSIKSISITGETDNRLDQINLWRHHKDIRALVMTTSTGGTGLTLNESSNTIFYSNHWSATDRLQAEDRNHRIGQTNKVTYHDIVVRAHLDARILKALKDKSNFADQFRGLMKQGKAANLLDFLRED